MPTPHRFSAVIYKLGINPCVEVPLRVSKAFNKRGYIYIAGTVNQTPIRATLVPIGGGRHRLFINGDMIKRSKVAVGDRITLTLHTASPRSVPMPKGLAVALRTNPDAKAAWDQLTPSRQKEIKRYLNFTKNPETLRRNITKTIAALTKKAQAVWVRVK